jgi:hypothetical protein
MEEAGKTQKRVVLTIWAKIEICNRLQCGENRNKLRKEYGIRSLTIYDIQIIIISIIFWYPENSDIQQNFGPGGAECCRF